MNHFSLRSWRFFLVGSPESRAKPGQNEWRSRGEMGRSRSLKRLCRDCRGSRPISPAAAPLVLARAWPTNKNRQLRRLEPFEFTITGMQPTFLQVFSEFVLLGISFYCTFYRKTELTAKRE